MLLRPFLQRNGTFIFLFRQFQSTCHLVKRSRRVGDVRHRFTPVWIALVSQREYLEDILNRSESFRAERKSLGVRERQGTARQGTARQGGKQRDRRDIT